MPELDEDEDSERSKIMELFQAPALQNPLASYLQKLLGMGRSPQAEGGGGEELPVGGQRAGKVGKDAKPLDEGVEVQIDLEGPPIGRLYPEWNWQASAATGQDWCAVAEYDPRPGEEEDASSTRARTARLRRELARLGLAHERHRRQDEGDVLDITALIELVVDRGAGGIGDPRVYELKRRPRTTSACWSCSTRPARPASRRREGASSTSSGALAARLTASFDELGDRVACYGFQSWGRHAVNYLRVKGFDDRYDHAAQRRLASLEPGGFTRLGAAIRHGTHMLDDEGGHFEHAAGGGRRRPALRRRIRAPLRPGGLPPGAPGGGASKECRLRLRQRPLADRARGDRAGLGERPHRALEEPSELARHVTPLFRGALREAAASRRRTATTSNVLSGA